MARIAAGVAGERQDIGQGTFAAALVADDLDRVPRGNSQSNQVVGRIGFGRETRKTVSAEIVGCFRAHCHAVHETEAHVSIN